MQKAGLYSKFPEDASLILDFKRYLTDSLSVSNCQQEVRSLYTLIISQFQQCSICILSSYDVNANIYFSLSLSKVDNVSRFLRYLQPCGDEPNLDFLKKSIETQDYLKRLRLTDMSTATILNYIKNMIRFVEFLKTKQDLGKEGTKLHSMCQAYKELLQTLRKPVAKVHSHAVVTMK